MLARAFDERRGSETTVEHARISRVGIKEGKGRTLKIDVIIPVYKPGRELTELLDRLETQTVSVEKIILMYTTEESAEEEILLQAEEREKVEVHRLARQEFDHGGTRHSAVQFSQGDIFVMLTQDAMPADEYLIERLTENLKGKVAVSYGRQLPGEDSNEYEKLSRSFNYPETSCVKSAADLERMGVKTFFCSDVCAAYRRDIYEESGGFLRHTIFNEDMIYAAGVIRAGYAVAYEALARVIHAHNYSNVQQLRRNFDLGVSQAEHPEVFRDVPSESEGKKLVREAWRYLKARRLVFLYPGFCLQCGFKYAGYLLGKNYRKLPKRWVLAITTNRYYWM